MSTINFKNQIAKSGETTMWPFLYTEFVPYKEIISGVMSYFHNLQSLCLIYNY